MAGRSDERFSGCSDSDPDSIILNGALVSESGGLLLVGSSSLSFEVESRSTGVPPVSGRRGTRGFRQTAGRRCSCAAKFVEIWSPRECR